MIDKTNTEASRSLGFTTGALAGVCAALAIIALILGTWSSYWAGQHNDQYQLIQLGQCVYDGGRMYVDCWENNPPGIAWINALAAALSSGGQFADWVLPAVFALLGFGAIGYVASKALSRTSASLVVLLAAVVYTLRVYDTPSINPDFYGSTLELAAFSLWVASLITGRLRSRLIAGISAGLLWAASTAVNPTGIVGLVAVTAVWILMGLMGRSSAGPWLAATGAAWCGCLIGTGAVAAVLYARGTLNEAWEAVVVFNRGLLGWANLRVLGDSWLRSVGNLSPIQLPLWLALLGGVAAVAGRRVNRLTLSVIVAMMVWWAVEVGLALLGPSRSMCHWQATFPAMLWLAAVGFFFIESVLRRLDRPYRPGLALACATLLYFLGGPLVDQYSYGLATSYAAFSEEQTERDRYTALGETLQKLVPSGESIYVWAYDAGVYVYSRRSPASRFTYPRSAEQMDQILTDLSQRRPYAVLLPEDKSGPFTRWCDDACHQRLDDTLMQYEPQVTIGTYRAWVRVPSKSVPPPT